MKRLLCVCIILSIVSTVLAFDELWQRAVEIQRNSETRVPGKIETNIIFPMSLAVIDLVFSQTVDENNELVSELVYADAKGKAVKDEQAKQKMLDGFKSKSSGSNATIEINLTEDDDEGDDIIGELISADGDVADGAEEVQELPEEISVQTSGSSSEKLFLETDSNKITVKRLKKTKKINGIPCVAYDVTYSPSGEKEDLQSGRVWLNSTTGAPVLTEMQIPSSSKEVKRTDLITYFKYEASTNTNVVDYFTLTVKINVLLILTFKHETTVKQSEYFTYPAIDL